MSTPSSKPYPISFVFLVPFLVVGSAWSMTKPRPDRTVRGDHFVKSCRGDAGEENCFWSHRYSQEHCTSDKPCEKAMVFFSGGDMSCDEASRNKKHALNKILEAYKTEGYFTICAGIFISNEASAKVPFHQEASRIEKLLKDIRDSSVVRENWSGKHLLVVGSSHGATAPLIAMKHKSLTGFKVSGKSAMCLFDGVYAPRLLDRYLHSSTPRAKCTAMRNRLICKRYLGADSCAYPVRIKNAHKDAILPDDIRKLEIKGFKLIECGSQLTNRCGVFGDLLPSSTIQRFCDYLQGNKKTSCDWDPMPTENHSQCAVTEEGISRCLDWFENKIAGP